MADGTFLILRYHAGHPLGGALGPCVTQKAMFCHGMFLAAVRQLDQLLQHLAYLLQNLQPRQVQVQLVVIPRAFCILLEVRFFSFGMGMDGVTEEDAAMMARS
jgi:hypothetical protein